MLGGKFGAASASLVIEEFMHGEEASFFALCDGETAVALGRRAGPQARRRWRHRPQHRRHGRLFARAILDAAMQQRVMDAIVTPTVRGMKNDGRPYRGVLFVGLMIDGASGPRVVEYNVRFGDPECQVIMTRLKDDPLPQLLACATGGLARLQAAGAVLRSGGHRGDGGDRLSGRAEKGRRDPRARRSRQGCPASPSSTPARRNRATTSSPMAAACSTYGHRRRR